jgi:hypothetical protein
MIIRKGGQIIEVLENQKERCDTMVFHSRISTYYEVNEVEMPVVGQKYFCFTCHYVGPNNNRSSVKKLWWSNDEKMIAEGMPGNSNHDIRRFHGWCGTTDDNHVDADGVRVCLSAERTEYQKTVHYKFVFGEDEAKDKD